MTTVLGSHADRPVQAVLWNGRPAVVKSYRRGDAEGIAETMTALWASPFGRDRRPPGAPEVIALEGDDLVMERIAGTPLGRRGELDGTAERRDEAAALLADLHGSGVEVARARPADRIVRSLERKLDSIPDDAERRLFAGALQALDPRALDGDLVVSHGDFSPRNVLASPAGLRLIDFDRCQMAPRARDATYWGAWAWATVALGGGTPGWDLGRQFEDAYARYARQPELSEQQRAAHRSAALLRIAHGWSALRARPDIAKLVLHEARHVSDSPL